uniref:Uncharacterized protein n=1 Tax=Mycena chlorophos TaxID=658473 RepID=A0ABQ0KYB7_MYCCL|nr:predicted protein [Mycena chlorophos]
MSPPRRSRPRRYLNSSPVSSHMHLDRPLDSCLFALALSAALPQHQPAYLPLILQKGQFYGALDIRDTSLTFRSPSTPPSAHSAPTALAAVAPSTRSRSLQNGEFTRSLHPQQYTSLDFRAVPASPNSQQQRDLKQARRTIRPSFDPTSAISRSAIPTVLGRLGTDWRTWRFS